MKKYNFLIISTCLLILLQTCSTPQFIHDSDSYKRQKELRSSRAGNMVGEILVGITSVCLAAALDSDIEYYPDEQEFKKLNLKNMTRDTMYVNMLTDAIWDSTDYCDFMDIRIPPHLNCKVMVPVETLYNLYYSTTPRQDDDKMMQIYTSDCKKIKLYSIPTPLTAAASQ